MTNLTSRNKRSIPPAKVKFRYRKVTPLILAEMKVLRAKGWSLTKIAKKFHVTLSTVRYHLTDYYKPQALARAKRSNKNQKETGYYQRPDVRKKRREWMRDYMRERYHNDAEFRRKMIRAASGGRFAE